jgi:hypothetical protein
MFNDVPVMHVSVKMVGPMHFCKTESQPCALTHFAGELHFICHSKLDVLRCVRLACTGLWEHPTGKSGGAKPSAGDVCPRGRRGPLQRAIPGARTV